MPEIVKKTILLVEDEMILALAERKQLENYGYAVQTVSTGEKAVEAVNASPGIDLILMDINLGPGIDGTEAAELILKDHDTPIVFVSSHSEREVVEKTERITSYGYVVKSSSITVLDASIKMAFKLFEANRNIQIINDKLVATIDALPDLLFEVGLDGYYFHIHSPHPELLFKPASELVGRKIPDILPHETADIFMSAIQEAHEKGISVGKQYQLALPSGGIYWFELSGSRIASFPDRPHFIFLVRDITERRRMEESLEKRIILLTSPLDNADSISFTDLFNMHDIQQIQDDFANATGVASIITKTDGTPITAPSNFCRLCNEIIRKSRTGNAHCMESDAELGRLDTTGPSIKTCLSGGLWDAGTSISIGGRHIANWLIGQVRDETQTEEKMLEYARAIGVDEQSYIEAFREVPMMTKEKFGQIATTLFRFATQLSTMAYQNVQQARLLTERRMAEDSLKTSEEQHRALIENSHDIIYTLSSDGMFAFVSSAWTTLLGHPVDQVIGKSFQEFVHPDDVAPCLAWLKMVIDTGMRQAGAEYRVKHLDGSWFWHTSSAVPLRDGSGTVIGFQGMARDITSQKRADGKIKSLLAEKELLLKEVHHRMKNNMNTISSLLSLQAQALTEPSAITALAETGNRVQSMGTLYDKLYRSADFSELSVKDYLPDLIDEIISNFPNSTMVKVEKCIEDFPLDAKRLQPLGIIINELLTNVMKYAFKGRKSGLVTVSATNVRGHITFSVHDDGNGMPESVSFETSAGFGLQLVQALTQQLEGTIRIERNNGTKFVIEFDE